MKKILLWKWPSSEKAVKNQWSDFCLLKYVKKIFLFYELNVEKIQSKNHKKTFSTREKNYIL